VAAHLPAATVHTAWTTLLSPDLIKITHQQHRARPRHSESAPRLDKPQAEAAMTCKATRPTPQSCRRVRVAVSTPMPLSEQQLAYHPRGESKRRRAPLQRRQHTVQPSQAKRLLTSWHPPMPCVRQSDVRTRTFYEPRELPIGSSACISSECSH